MFRANGEVQRKRPRGQRLPHRCHGAVEVGVLLVQLVDDHDSRLAGPVAVLPGDLGAHRELRRWPDHHHGSFGRAQPADHLAGKVEESRRIKDVDLVAVVLREPDPEVDRDPPLLLFGLEVHRRRRLVGRTHPRDRAGGKKHGFGEHGLAIVRVTQQDHVSDLVGSVISRHPNPHLKRAQQLQREV